MQGLKQIQTGEKRSCEVCWGSSRETQNHIAKAVEKTMETTQNGLKFKSKKKREKAMKDNWFKFETVVARELDRERVVRLVGEQNVGYTFPHIKRHIEGNKQETRRKIRESERK